MARREAILRLHNILVARRTALIESLSGELDVLSDRIDGDSADAATDAVHEAVSSELADIESRELAQIERALGRIRAGFYGTCEECEQRIPVERLNVLPYTTHCVRCQRNVEAHGRRANESEAWERVSDSDVGDPIERIRLSEIEFHLARDGV